MTIIDLTIDEKNEISDVADKFSFECKNLSLNDQLKKIPLYFGLLPNRLIEKILEMKYQESIGAIHIKGLKLNEDIGNTPKSWREASTDISKEDTTLLIISALLGDAIAWSSQQNGRLVHNIVPVKGDEYKQIGSSTLDVLCWHTEEAFHDCRCDYLALLCLRNPQKAATLAASIDTLDLNNTEKTLLFEPNYIIAPDDSHVENKKDPQNADEKVPILFGDFTRPYMRIDPFYMNIPDTDEPSNAALKKIISQIDSSIFRIVLEPGDLLLIDNFTMVHGREAYKANYDGMDRWLKRVNITRDLRKSRKLRSSSDSRVINYNI